MKKASLLFLGLLSLDTGLSLAGSPVSFTRAINTLASHGRETAQAPAPAGGVSSLDLPGPQAGQPAVEVEGEDVVTINVLNTRYDPDRVIARAGVPVKLKLVTRNVISCSLSFVIPSLNEAVSLKTTGVKYIDIPPQKAGTRMPFSCSMGMFTGDIYFE